ncbi:MAG: hypothetical protein ACE5JB_16835 [bacterium]
MEFLKSQLVKFAKVYQQAIEDIRNLEDKTAASAINPQYTNNIRHALEHLATAIQKASKNPKDPKDSKEHIQTAISHILNIAPDSYEYIAGVKLTQTRKRIASAGFFAERDKAKRLHEDAIYHYTQGRNERTANPEQANHHFERAIDLCLEAIDSVVPATNIQKGSLLIGLLGLLGVIVAVILFLDRIFHFLPSVF